MPNVGEKHGEFTGVEIAGSTGVFFYPSQLPPSSTEFPTRAAASAATIDANVSHITVLGRLAAGDGGVQRYKRVADQPPHPGYLRSNGTSVFWEVDTVVNARSFGAVSDAADDPDANNQAFSDFATSVVSTGLDGWIPKGRYSLDPSLAGATPFVFVMQEASAVRVYGDGEGETILQFADSMPNTAGAFWHLMVVRMSTADLNGPASAVADSFELHGLTLDGNLRNQPAPVGGNDYEQRSLFKAQILNTNRLRSIFVHDVAIEDPVADGLFVGPSTTVSYDLDGDGTFETATIGIARITRVREGKRDGVRSTILWGSGVGSMEISHVDTGLGNGSIQTEFESTPVDLINRAKISDCDIGSVDFTAKNEADGKRLFVQLSNVRTREPDAFGWAVVNAVNCHFVAGAAWVGSDLTIVGGTIRSRVNGGVVEGITWTGTDSTQRKAVFRGVEHVIDDPAGSFAGGSAFRTNNTLNTDFKYYFTDNLFDQRFPISLDCYSGGHIITKGCRFAGTVVAVQIGNQNSSFSTAWDDYDSDFTGAAQSFHLPASTPPENLSISLNGGKYSVPGFTETDAEDDYPTSFKLSTRRFQAVSVPTGGGVAGDIAYLADQSARWRCTTTSALAATWVSDLGGAGGADDYIEVADNAALAADNSANNRQDGFVWKVLTSRMLYMRGEGGAVPIETLTTSISDADMFTITEQVANQRCYRSDLNVVYMWRPQGFWAMEHMDPPTSAATATNQTVVIGTTRWMSRLLGGSTFAWDLQDHDVIKNDERTLSSPSSHGLVAGDLTDVTKNGWILDKDGMPVPGNASASGKFTPAFDIIEIVNTTQYVARARGTFLDKSYTWDLTNGGAVVDGVPIENSRWMLLQADGTMDHAADPNVSLVNGYFINANLIIIPGRQPTFTATTEIPTFAAFDVTLGGPYTMLRSDKTIVYTNGGVGAGVINLIDAEFFARHWFDGRAITNKSGDTLTLSPKPGEKVNGLASANVPDGVTWHMELDPLDPTNIVARV